MTPAAIKGVVFMHSRLEKLSTIPAGRVVKIARLQGGSSFRQRLTEMGLGDGQEISVLSSGSPGPFLLRIKDSKIAIGRGMAEKIMVRR